MNELNILLTERDKKCCKSEVEMLKTSAFFSDQLTSQSAAVELSDTIKYLTTKNMSEFVLCLTLYFIRFLSLTLSLFPAGSSLLVSSNLLVSEFKIDRLSAVIIL